MRVNTGIGLGFSEPITCYPIENRKDAWATGEIHIKFHEAQCSPEKATKLLEKHKLEIIEARGPFELIVRPSISSNQHPLNIAIELQKSKRVELAEADIATLIRKCEA